MKYYLLALLGSILLVTGCDVDNQADMMSRRPTADQGKHVIKQWEDGHVSCVTIEGHRYFLTHVSGGYTKGPSGIIHAESCHCKQ